MKGQVAFEALGALSDTLILEAAEKLGFLDEATPVAAPPRRRKRTALTRFFGTGWGVAMICAVVSLSVLGGIIWAGRRPPAGGPGGITPPETETPDYAGETQDEVTVRHGDTVIYPQRFFLWSMNGGYAVDGLGFAGDAAVYHNNQPSLPKVIYAKDGSISPCELTLAKGYSLDYVTVYGTDMTEIPTPRFDGDFSYVSLLQFLPAGRYYVSMQIRHKSSGYDYAFELEVIHTAEGNTDTESPDEEIISEEKAKEIASAYWDIRDGDRDPDNGFEFRIECNKTTAVTSRGEEVYVVLLRWLVDGQRWSTVDTVWVNRETGEVIIPYEDLGKETETEGHVHTYSEGEVVKISTCAETGEMKYVCPCGSVKIETIPALPHTEVVDAAVPPTVTETGLKEGKHCEVCGKVLVKQTVIPATGHTDLAYEVNDDGRTCTITGMGTCTATEIYIPSAIDGYKVTRIGEIAFINKPITAVHFPSSVTEIYDGAFYGCTELTEITLPSSITSLGRQVFQYCTGLTTATLQCRITELPHMTFDGCSSLASVTLPSTLTQIRMAAFSNCTGLQEITFPSSLGMIGVGAFQGCTSLTNVTLPAKLGILDDTAFEGCIGLTEMILPDTLNRIGANALSGCSGITAITVPKGVKQAEPSAFVRMEGLTDIYFRGTEAEWNAIGYEVEEGVRVHFNR